MFSTGELTAMTATVEESLGAASGLGASVVFLRNGVALPAQSVRLVRPSGAGTAGGVGTESAQAVSQLVGPPALNVQARDRFVLDGLKYEVIAVMPQRQIGTLVQVRSVQ